MLIYQDSHIGNVRSINQDYISYMKKSDHDMLVVLCDGMGGHNGGEVASRITCEDIINSYSLVDGFENEDEIKAWIYSAINHAHKALQAKSHQQSELEGMGTTVVVCYIYNDKVYISHVGDSRAYYYNDQMIQLTKDHTLVNALVENGTISMQEALYHPRKNILLQAVGASEILQVSYYTQDFNDGCIFLCSDGLYNSLSQKYIETIIKESSNLDDVGKNIMAEALRLGGSDNISFVIIDKGVFKDDK